MEKDYLHKITVVSICDNYNYGNRLQSYALQKFLKDKFEDRQSIYRKKV